MTEQLLTPAALAEFLNVPIATVYGFNYKGSGPRVLRVGRHVRYRQADVEAWLDRQVSERPQPASVTSIRAKRGTAGAA
jgi:predicted DNA-binding transcriptional regulator AlpA